MNSKYDQEYDALKNLLTSDNDNHSIKKIVNQIDLKSTVLEFGSSSGYMTKFLKEEKQCEVSIIEYDEKSAKKASKHAEKTIVGDIENYAWKKELKGQTFDYITFADVLEHLKDPWTVLENISEFLKPDGKVLISIPNISHNGIIIDLWNNKFKYHNLGLLDNTHLRFFGINNLEDMFKNSDLEVIITDGVYLKEKKTQLKNSLKDVNILLRLLLRFRTYGRVYQTIITAQKETFIKENNIVSKNLLRKRK
ncbi:MAG: class I SAM-dependent methyltransferase [Proteobacteria bacterium]|nr:class I SAM-dependent methyltransferase [Pseudomonadota bacterium]